jgi:transcriptional antiterminator RfaH
MHWYVIRTKPHQESRAECHLRQLPVETFLPLVKHHKWIRRQKKTAVEPLFPRYFFAQFDIDHRYRAVNFANGVLNIVEFGSKPAEVSESVIEDIRKRLVNGYVIPQTERFQQGQSVRIKSGPFEGLEAVFIREMSQQDRVLLLLNTLGLQAKLSMEKSQIIGIAPDSIVKHSISAPSPT